MIRFIVGNFINFRKESAGSVQDLEQASSAMAVAMRAVLASAEISPNCSPGPTLRVIRNRPLSSRLHHDSPLQNKECVIVRFSLPQQNIAGRHRPKRSRPPKSSGAARPAPKPVRGR